MSPEPFGRRERQIGPEQGEVDAILDSLTNRIRRLQRCPVLRCRLFWRCTHVPIVAVPPADNNPIGPSYSRVLASLCET